MRPKLTELEKRMAYVLNKDMNFNYTMTNIARMMGVSQSTISNAIKEIEYLRQIRNLEAELFYAKQEILKLQANNEIQPITPITYVGVGKEVDNNQITENIESSRKTFKLSFKK